MVKGWDIAMSCMKVGESARINCSAQYAYGDAGVPSVIPPNANVTFDIKILAWLGNSLSPDSLFQKGIGLDPFADTTPQTIQAELPQLRFYLPEANNTKEISSKSTCADSRTSLWASVG